MARPRIFISSTFYDLKHIRSSLDIFLESLGFDTALSEKGGIAYLPDRPLDESCYNELKNCDLFVLIVGGRYGSATSQDSEGHSASEDATQLSQYTSVSRKEFETAIKLDIPVYILVESGVRSEYDTYLSNKNNETINYAHVDQKGVFEFLEHIFRLKRNNPVQSFERFSDIEVWLREQFSGLFKELLIRVSREKEVRDINQRISELNEINSTLKIYLEEIMSVTLPRHDEIISSEKKRLLDSKKQNQALQSPLLDYIRLEHDISNENSLNALLDANNLRDFVDTLTRDHELSESGETDLLSMFSRSAGVVGDANDIREIFGLSRFGKLRA
ncbi:MAG: DUF4062 domain-containing protein [Pseudomonadota bacterium]